MNTLKDVIEEMKTITPKNLVEPIKQLLKVAYYIGRGDESKEIINKYW